LRPTNHSNNGGSPLRDERGRNNLPQTVS